MRTNHGRRLGLSAALLLMTAMGTLGQPPAPEKKDTPEVKVEVKVVKHDDLSKAVKQFKGSVVVVDCWGIT